MARLLAETWTAFIRASMHTAVRTMMGVARVTLGALRRAVMLQRINEGRMGRRCFGPSATGILTGIWGVPQHCHTVAGILVTVSWARMDQIAAAS